ncbi:MAG TPA: tetratricopeptide repeat protein [Thermoguttaceae bacterium]|nr:tetratricopeptide repeat protein [Thermoguttaceae bacterium]
MKPWICSALLVAVGCLTASIRPGQAADQPPQFLEGLRDRGRYDEALEYLEQARDKPSVPEEFKQIIDFETAVTLIDLARIAPQTSIREERLVEAGKRLQHFLSEYPTHDLARSARMKLADVLVERSRIQLQRAESAATSPEDRARSRSESRKLLQQAQEALAAVEKMCVERHQEFPKLIPAGRPKLYEQRQQVRADLLQSRLSLATLDYEMAKTYDPGSPERNKFLSEAAEKYGLMYEKYSIYMAGLYAHMWQGRCYKELGEPEKALEIFEDLLVELDNSPPFATLKGKALILALETALSPAAKDDRRVITRARDWLGSDDLGHPRNAHGLATRYEVGVGLLEAARPLKWDDARRSQYLETAEAYLRHVASYPGDFQEKAEARLAELGVTLPKSGEEDATRQIRELPPIGRD